MTEIEKYFNLSDVGAQFPDKVTRLSCDGEVYFLKRRVSDRLVRRKLMRLVQRFLLKILRLKILAPTTNVRKSSAYEPKKLIKLADLGLNVPKVLFFNDDYFIMSDCGMTLKGFAKRNPDLANDYLQQAIRHLAELHNSGHAHGGAQIRNFAVKDGQICLFDFEEIIPKKYCEEMQFRDILVFLISLSRSKRLIVDYRGLLEAYDQVAEAKGRVQRLLLMGRRYRWLAGLAKSRFPTLFGMDVYYLSMLIGHLLALQGDQSEVTYD